MLAGLMFKPVVRPVAFRDAGVYLACPGPRIGIIGTGQRWSNPAE